MNSTLSPSRAFFMPPPSVRAWEVFSFLSTASHIWTLTPRSTALGPPPSHSHSRLRLFLPPLLLSSIRIIPRFNPSISIETNCPPHHPPEQQGGVPKKRHGPGLKPGASSGWPDRVSAPLFAYSVFPHFYFSAPPCFHSFFLWGWMVSAGRLLELGRRGGKEGGRNG